MLAIIKKYKLFIILAIIIVVLALLKFFLANRTTPTLPGGEFSPSPFSSSAPRTENPSPFPNQISPSPIFQPLPGKLNLVSSYPEKGINETLFSQYKIVLTFDKNVRLDTLKFSIFPQITLVPSADKNTLSFYPKSAFLFDTDYLLTIDKLDSLDDQPLAAPIKYQFRLSQPTNVYVW